MSGLFPAGTRIGCVPYLNAKPLVFGIEDRVVFDVPSVLAERFGAGEFDVALLPVFKVLEMTQPLAVDGLSISAFGPVRSVIVAHRRPLSETPRICLDTASRSSSNLLRVLLRGYFQLSPELVETSDDPDVARLIIGDPALDFQREARGGWGITDLAAAWRDWTGQPFVFAVWAIRADCEGAARIAAALTSVAERGLSARREISARENDPEAAWIYLTQNIRHDLPPEAKAGLDRFAEECTAAGLLRKRESTIRWIGPS